MEAILDCQHGHDPLFQAALGLAIRSGFDTLHLPNLLPSARDALQAALEAAVEVSQEHGKQHTEPEPKEDASMEVTLVDDEEDRIEDELFLFDEYHGNGDSLIDQRLDVNVIAGNTCKGKEKAKDIVDSISYNYTSNDLTEPVYDATETCEAIHASLESLIGETLEEGTLPPDLESAMQSAFQDAVEALLLLNLPDSHRNALNTLVESALNFSGQGQDIDQHGHRESSLEESSLEGASLGNASLKDATLENTTLDDDGDDLPSLRCRGTRYGIVVSGLVCHFDCQQSRYLAERFDATWKGRQ